MRAANWATPDDLQRLADAAKPRRAQPEKRFTERIKRYAKRGGWLCYHNLHAKGSDPGFLDLIMIRPPRLVVAEQKVEGRKLTDWQEVWTTYWQVLSLLAGPHLSIEIYLWEPEDMPLIEQILE